MRGHTVTWWDSAQATPNKEARAVTATMEYASMLKVVIRLMSRLREVGG